MLFWLFSLPFLPLAPGPIHSRPHSLWPLLTFFNTQLLIKTALTSLVRECPKREWELSMFNCVESASDLLSFLKSTRPAAVWPHQWRGQGFTGGPGNQQNPGRSGYKEKPTYWYVVCLKINSRMAWKWVCLCIRIYKNNVFIFSFSNFVVLAATVLVLMSCTWKLFRWLLIPLSLAEKTDSLRALPHVHLNLWLGRNGSFVC